MSPGAVSKAVMPSEAAHSSPARTPANGPWPSNAPSARTGNPNAANRAGSPLALMAMCGTPSAAITDASIDRPPTVSRGLSPPAIRRACPPARTTAAVRLSIIRKGWGEQRDSNPRHPRPQPGALPTELCPPSRPRGVSRLPCPRQHSSADESAPSSRWTNRASGTSRTVGFGPAIRRSPPVIRLPRLRDTDGTRGPCRSPCNGVRIRHNRLARPRTRRADIGWHTRPGRAA